MSMNPASLPGSPLPACHRILVVDDNPSIHSDFRKILCPSRSGSAAADDLEAILFGETEKAAAAAVTFELQDAFQGQEALDMVQAALAENRPYALAFVDVRMPPGWDGVETIRRLWEAHPRLQVVICTAYSDYSWEEMRARLGQPDSLVVLKKPFDNVEVQQLAHALTSKYELNIRAELRRDELENMVRQRTAELALANENLARSEERFAKAFQTNPVAMAIESLPDRRLVDVNERMTQLAGYRREEMVGQLAQNLFVWTSPQMVDDWFEGLLRGETVRSRETEWRDQSGNLHQVAVSLWLVSLAGRPHALLAVQDVTERNLLERQLRQAQKMEAIGQLAAGVAHDFNNILTVIHGHAGMIKNQLASGVSPAESAEKIAGAAHRAAALIRQLLMFSRKQVMQFRHLDLNEALQHSLAMLGRLVGEHVRLTFVPSASLPAIHADPTMIEQVVMNLAVNARDAMPNGGEIRITTEVVTVDQETSSEDSGPRPGPYVQMTFSDTGCGMDTTLRSRIFEPFFTTQGVGQGTGLGLSTVFGIVRQHEGWLDVTSSPGKGSAFRLLFPVSTQKPEKLLSSADTSMLLRGRETVLVAEDEEVLREMVTVALAAQGYEVLAASSGVEALTLYEQAGQPIDLLLTDMVMPGGVMGGDLAARLREINPGLKVIFTSGYSPGMAGKDLSLLEGRNFLPKPYSVGKLTHVVRQVLDQPELKN